MFKPASYKGKSPKPDLMNAIFGLIISFIGIFILAAAICAAIVRG